MIIKKIHKAFYWEYWPSSMFYIPNLPYAFYLAAKANNLVFFSAANPSIKSAGNGTESKFTTLKMIPKKYRPKSILHTANYSIAETILKVDKKKMVFPLIAKPDVGFRGMLVKIVNSEKELQNYLRKYPVDIIIQEYIDYKNECGIFYSRNPNNEKGAITSITLKKYLNVIGDGKSSLKILILEDKRAKLFVNQLLKLSEQKLNSIPRKNQEVQLSVIGNHSKGAQFLNGNHLISEDLTNTFDKLSKLIPGWFYGRIDIKYDKFSDLENNSNFKILEINGIIAEPTHIYDAKNTNYFQALKAIRTHWKYLYEISITNHKDFEVPYKSSKEFISEILELRSYSKKITNFQL